MMGFMLGRVESLKKKWCLALVATSIWSSKCRVLIAMLHPAVVASCSCPNPYPWRHHFPGAATVTVRMTPLPIVRGKAVVASRIRCMANPRRVQMVAKQIRRELSDMLLTDKVLQYAILPETSLGADRYLSSLTTITDVQVSGDLQASFLSLSLCLQFLNLY